jgi:hypothetical protein
MDLVCFPVNSLCGFTEPPGTSHVKDVHLKINLFMSCIITGYQIKNEQIV